MNKEKLQDTKKNGALPVVFFLLLIFLLGIFLYARHIGTKGLIVKEYKIESNKLPMGYNGVKIIHFSDLHYGRTTSIEDVKVLKDRINILKPDLIFFTGDLIANTKSLNDKEKEKLITELTDIEYTIGKYAVKGDVDYENLLVEDILTAAGFIILENSYDLVYSNSLTPLFIGGVSSPLKKEIDLSSLFSYYETEEEEAYKAEYKIILSHEGDIIKQILGVDNSVDLVLSGHSLNGSVVIPYYGQAFLPKGSTKYYAPYYKEGTTNIFISSGIGTNEYKFRLFNRPSFNFYRLKSL